MAVSTGETNTPEKPSLRTELWAMAGVACVALLCMGLLAGTLALILGKGSHIQVNSVVGGGAVYAPPTTPVTNPAGAPASGPAVVRRAPAESAPALPPASSAPAAVRAEVEGSMRPLPEALFGGAAAVPPAPAVQARKRRLRRAPVAAVDHAPVAVKADARQTLAEAAVRGLVPDFSDENRALPMPVRRAALRRRAPFQSPSPMVRAVAASPVLTRALEGGKMAPGIALRPVSVARTAIRARTGAPAAAAPEPATAHAVSSGKAAAHGPEKLARLKLEGTRTTASLPGYSLSPGNVFFTARVWVRNDGKAPLAVDADAFDLDDGDGASYMALPAPARPPVAPGARVERTLSFLVPKDAVMSSLSLVLPTETDALTLTRP